MDQVFGGIFSNLWPSEFLLKCSLSPSAWSLEGPWFFCLFGMCELRNSCSVFLMGGGGSCLLRCTIWHIPFRSGHLPEPTVVGPAGFLPFSIVSPLVHFVSASFLLHNIISSRRLELGEVKKGRVYRKKGSLHTKHVSH